MGTIYSFMNNNKVLKMYLHGLVKYEYYQNRIKNILFVSQLL